MNRASLPLRRRHQDDHERLLTCTHCRAEILVCGHVRALDPRVFVGLACGCRRSKPSPTTNGRSAAA